MIRSLFMFLLIATSAFAEDVITGVYVPPAPPVAYTQDFSISTQLNNFISDVKASSVFSLPGNLFVVNPGSGSSVVSFDAGMYGNHSFDFASFSSLWLILKVILLLIFGFLSIRVIVLG